MRIGAFAKHNQTSIDTIRHYMDLSLLVPEKVGGQYDFDTVCQIDYEEVFKLKNIGFTLSEIQTLLLFKRIGKLTDYEQRVTYKAFFDNKRAAIDIEKKRLTRMALALDSEIATIHQSAQAEKPQHTVTGVPIESLEQLQCKTCHTSYAFTDGTLVNREILEGTLQCACGQSLTVQKGVLIGEGGICDVNRTLSNGYKDTFIDDYILTTSPDYLKKLYQSLDWTKRHIDFRTLEGDICLELGTGHGFFMRHFIADFPAKALYIAVDYDLESLLWLKQIFERNRPKCKILYLCANFETLPLKPQSIDFLLDISGSSNYAFDANTFLLEKLDPLTKPNTVLHGHFILFSNFVKHSKVKENHRELFRWKFIESKLESLNYRCIDQMRTEAVDQGGPLENYFVAGERVYNTIYHGKKTK